MRPGRSIHQAARGRWVSGLRQAPCCQGAVVKLSPSLFGGPGPSKTMPLDQPGCPGAEVAGEPRRDAVPVGVGPSLTKGHPIPRQAMSLDRVCNMVDPHSISIGKAVTKVIDQPGSSGNLAPRRLARRHLEKKPTIRADRLLTSVSIRYHGPLFSWRLGGMHASPAVTTRPHHWSGAGGLASWVRRYCRSNPTSRLNRQNRCVR